MSLLWPCSAAKSSAMWQVSCGQVAFWPWMNRFMIEQKVITNLKGYFGLRGGKKTDWSGKAYAFLLLYVNGSAGKALSLK